MVCFAREAIGGRRPLSLGEGMDEGRISELEPHQHERPSGQRVGGSIEVLSL